MKAFGAVVIALALLTPNSSAAAQSAAASAKVSTKNSHGTFTVELVKGLDSRKLKEGDAVEAKLTGGITLPDGTVVPRGTSIVGHVTQASARAKHDSESALGISFDRIASPGGGKTLIKGVVLAAAPNPEPTGSPDATGNIYTRLDSATEASVVDTQTSRPVPLLSDKSRGVLGIEDLNLRPDGVFTSGGKEVKLNTGIRLLLSVTLQ